MPLFRQRSLKQKITALIVTASCVVLLLSCSIFVGSQVVTYKRITVNELNAVADIVARNITAAMVFDDAATAQETLAALSAKSGIMVARAYRSDGSLFAEYRRRTDDADATAEIPTPTAAAEEFPDLISDRYEHRFGGGHVDLHAPVRLDGELIGAIYVRSDLKQMYDIVGAYMVLAGFVVMFLIVVAFLIANRLQQVISAPVLNLLGTMRRVSEHQDYSVRAEKFSDDELGQLTDGFNEMLARVQDHDRHLRHAWQEAEAASRAKTEFLANMSHELRTPLNAIIGFSEIIKTEMLGPLGTDRYRFYAHDIYESGQHLLEVINDILDLSKVEAGEFELHEEQVDLDRLIEKALRLVRERAETAQLKLVVDTEPRLPQIYVDQRLVKQSLINLLSNAVKFSAGPGEIVVRAGVVSDGSVLLSVTDHGIGMAEDDIPKVLQPFSQVESAFARSHEGTGLGLPLANSFIAAHGGRLEIRSTLGEGTTVTLYFPAERAVGRDRSAPGLPAAG